MKNHLKEIRLKFDVLSISILLICLIPLGFSLGPLIPEILFLLIFILNFKSIYLEKKKYFFNFFVYWFFGFYVYLLLNSLFLNLNYFNNFQEYLMDQKSIIFFFRYILYFVGVWYLFDKIEDLKRLLLISLSLTILIIVVDAFYQYFTDINFLGYKKIVSHRLSGIFKDELILGSYLFRIYFVFLSLFIFLNDLSQKKNLYIFLIVGTLFGTLIFLSGERSAFLLFLFSNLILFIFLKCLKLKSLLKFFTLLMSFIIIFSLTDTNIQQRMIFTTIEDVYDEKKNKVFFFTKVHHGHYMSAKLMLRENPFLGVGTKRFKTECKKTKYYHYTNRCANHPHNYYVQLFSETGIFGGFFLIFIYLVLIKLLIFSYYKGKNYDYSLVLLIGLLAMFWPIAPHGNFFNNWLIMNSIICLSLYFHFSYKKL